MILSQVGYSYNDVTIIPSIMSSVKSRKECNPYTNNKLPIFTAPMASVVSDENYEEFLNNNIIPIIPRNISIDIRKELMKKEQWIALSLNEFKEIFIDNVKELENLNYYICVDIANGHMQYLYDLCKNAKKLSIEYNYSLTIMVGNIANPDTYKDIIKHNNVDNLRIIDYVRCGIGGGFGCITSSNTSIHYPIASLIDKCNDVKEDVLNNYNYREYRNYLPYIIADGGIRNYSDVIKALALGADYVMIGSLFARCIESAGPKYQDDNYELKKIYKDYYINNGSWYAYFSDEYIKNSKDFLKDLLNFGVDNKISYNDNTLKNYEEKAKKPIELGKLSVKFFGMASSDGQIAISGKKTKTAEGITKYIPVEYTLKTWVKNMEDYLRSAMSYCNSFTLNDFIGKQNLMVNSMSEILAVNK